ncbi:Ribosome biogenesis protein erb1 [Elasticomyces elasticus]|nr:Ribosome biogenesis protein erb1 [Elasticomyces elasticus]
MAIPTLSRKRKLVTRKSPSPEEDLSEAAVPDGRLDGFASEEEDSNAEESVGESDLDDEDDEISGEELDSGDELGSDEIPSEDDEDGIRKQLRNLKTGDGSNGDLMHTNGDGRRVRSTSPSLPSVSAERERSPEDDSANYTIEKDANGNTRYMYRPIDPVYDSDDSDAPATTNTIGDIPLSFYEAYPHIGYDINGKRIMRPARGEALDALLDSIDLPKGWTGLTDPATGKPLQLSREELEVLRKLTRNEAPGDGYDPYPDMVEWFTSKTEIMPLSAAPEPKRRFIPSKHEAKRVMKIVRAIREGRILPYKAPSDEEQEDLDVINYDLWANEAPRPDHPMNIPAPKLPPPGYAESYHPPPEYLPDQIEKQAWEDAEEEDRDKDFLPTDHTALRKVPGYARFIKDRFERCLDLYLAPRVRRSKLNIDPESLLPKLPSPDELRPFPTVCATQYVGHKGRVRTVSVSPCGRYLASGGDDGTVRVWALLTGRQVWSCKFSSDEAVNIVRWRPGRDALILTACAGDSVYFAVPLSLCDPNHEVGGRAILDDGFGYATTSSTTTPTTKPTSSKWTRPTQKLQDAGVLLQITLNAPPKSLSYHRRGDYFSTVSPASTSTAVSIHTLSKHLTQHPFRRLRGLAQTTSFHPSKALFFLATRQSVRVYDLQAQNLVKTLQPGAKWISSLDVHPLGDNLLLGSYDRRLLWHDLDLSLTPYKTLRYHSKAIRAVKFHPNSGAVPLFADCSDDGTVQIFHGKVVGDGMENATIVPLKVLKGHRVTAGLGVLDLDWHPREPWCVSAGADGRCRLWC